MNQSIPRDWKPVRGNCYPVREELKEIGARWDRETGMWWVPPSKEAAAREIVEERRR
jgi:hypothetical protein